MMVVGILSATWSIGSESRAADAIFEHDGQAVQVLDQGAGEGPAWHPDHGLLFSGNGRINRLTQEGRIETFDSQVVTNGLAFDRQGRLLRCENAAGRISRQSFGPVGKVEVLTEAFNGNRYNQPNDITWDSKDRIYFSDPLYGPRDGIRQFDAKGQPVEGVYRIDLDGKVTRIITHEVDRPNGLLVSRNDKYLFVADNNNNTDGGARILWRFALQSDGSVDFTTQKKLYDWGTGRGPDGMAEDTAGHLYVAAGLNAPQPPFETVDAHNRAGVYVFDYEGNQLGYVPVPRDEVTNCAFGGEDLRTLYVTAGGTLWSVRTVAAGIP
jgi:gluconolactonase